MHGQANHLNVRPRRPDLPRGLDAIEAGHAHVHDHDIGLELGRQIDGFLPIGCCTHDLDTRLLFEERGQAEGVVRVAGGRGRADRAADIAAILPGAAPRAEDRGARREDREDAVGVRRHDRIARDAERGRGAFRL